MKDAEGGKRQENFPVHEHACGLQEKLLERPGELM